MVWDVPISIGVRSTDEYIVTIHRHPGQAAGTPVTAHTTDNIGGTWPGGVWGNRQDRLGGRIPDYAHTGDEDGIDS